MSSRETKGTAIARMYPAHAVCRIPLLPQRQAGEGKRDALTPGPSPKGRGEKSPRTAPLFEGVKFATESVFITFMLASGSAITLVALSCRTAIIAFDTLTRPSPGGRGDVELKERPCWKSKDW